MAVPVCIRREDKNEWERRAPLSPDHVAELVRDHGLAFFVQASGLRAFADDDYRAAGARVSEELGGCPVVLGVKEIPVDLIERGRTYVSFSHVVKGQPSGMPALRRYLDVGATLIDYERIVDREGRRLIFFGRHAGYAGMIDTLWALGRRLATEGYDTPLSSVRQAHHYDGLDDATDHISRIGERIRHGGLPVGLRPVVVAFTGSGNVALGAEEVFDRLPFVEIDPEELLALEEDRDRPRSVLFKTVLEREHRLERIEGGGFDAAEYAEKPAAYRSAMMKYLPHVTVLVNGVYWQPGLPRLVTRAQVERLFDTAEQPKLRVIADITCDVGGSIEVNVKATDPGDPVYVYDVATGETRMGVAGHGPVILAVDNLPCELPRESSQHFGDSLLRYVPALSRCDWGAPFDTLALPRELKDAIITHQGRLTPGYTYLEEHLEGRS